MRPCRTCRIPQPESEYRPSRSKCRTCERAYQRDLTRKNIDVIRERKRRNMAKRRETPEGRSRERQIAKRCYDNGGNVRQRERLKRIRATDFFKWRSLRSYDGITFSAEQLRALWDSQGGRCALTGRQLSDSAQLDHILPRARGGETDISNLRWVCEEANIAKRHMTDDEFLTLCRECVEWIARRIAKESGGSGADGELRAWKP